MNNEITYTIAKTENDFLDGKKLFEEYAKFLNMDLCFQNFECELKTMDQQYNKPFGVLLLACSGESVIGCVGIRKFDEEIAELKRMYVKSEFRGFGIGATLLKRALELAKELTYKKVRLDTLESMKKAWDLYRSFGFYEIPAFRFNPMEGAVYMEKVL